MNPVHRLFFLKGQRRETRLTPEKKIEIQQYYQSGHGIGSISVLVDVKQDTIQKAIKAGRLILPGPENKPSQILTKSQRSSIDNERGMGKACTNTLERVMASKSGTSCPVSFTNQIDLHQAGVLLALPALLAHGLLKYSSEFERINGYYSADSIFITLSFLALLRIKTLSQLSISLRGSWAKPLV